VLVEHDLDLLPAADLVLVLPGADVTAQPPERVLEALRGAHRRGATVAAHCLGVFLPAAAGLLDGLEATTHWQYASELGARYPGVTVRPEALYIDQGAMVTAAGAAAGIDMCLHLLRRDYDAALANAIAASWSSRRTATAGSSSSSPLRCPPARTASASPTSSPGPGRTWIARCRSMRWWHAR